MNKHRSSAPIIPTYAKVILFGQNVSIPSGNISSTHNIPRNIDQDATFTVPKNLFNLKNDSGAPYLVKQDIQAIGYPMQAAQDRFDNFRKINIKLDVAIKTKTTSHLQAKKSLPKLYTESLLKKYSQKVSELQEKFKAYTVDTSQKIESGKKSRQSKVRDIVLKTERKIQNTYSIKFFTMEDEGVNSISKRVPINSSSRLSKNERSSSRLRTQTRESEFHREPFNRTFRLSNKNLEETHYLGLTQESVYVNTSHARKRSLTTEESLHEEGVSTLETELKSHRNEEGVISMKSSQKSAVEKIETKNLETLEDDDEQETQSLSDYCHDATTGGNFVTDKFFGMHKNEKNFVDNKSFVYGASSGHAVANPAIQTNYANFERNVVSLNKLKASITKAGIKPYKKTKWINQSNPFKKTQDLENNNNNENSFGKGSSSYAKLLQTMYSQKNIEEDRIPEVSRDQETLLQTSLDNSKIIGNRALESAKVQHNEDRIKNDSKGKLKILKHQNGYMRVSRKKIIVGAESMIADGLSILDKSQENSDH